MADLPKLEDWHAPWELDPTTKELVPEDQQVIDTGKLKKFLHGLLTDKDRLQTKVVTITSERDSARADLDTKLRESEGDDGKRKREHDDAIKAAREEGELKALRLEVALGIDGITPAQARRLAARLTGKDRDELEEDAKGLAEDFGIGTGTADEGSEENPAVPGRPRRQHVAGDPNPTEKSLPDVNDPAALNKAFPRR